MYDQLIAKTIEHNIREVALKTGVIAFVAGTLAGLLAGKMM